MAAIQGSVRVETSFQQSLATAPGNPVVSIPQRIGVNFGPGTAADMADLKHTRRYALAGAPVTIDLTAAVDDLGTANFARVRSITIRTYAAADAAVLTLGGAGSNLWTGIFSGTYKLAPGSAANPSVWAQTAPNTTGYLVSGTSKILQLNPGSATFAVDVEIVGASA